MQPNHQLQLTLEGSANVSLTLIICHFDGAAKRRRQITP